MFKVINTITSKQKVCTREEVYKSGLNLAVLIKHLASSPATVGIASYLNRNWKLDVYDMYLFAYANAKKCRVQYVKRDKKEMKSEQAEIVMEYYNVSYDVAKKYLVSLDDLQYNTIEEIVKASHGIYKKAKKAKVTKKDRTLGLI